MRSAIDPRPAVVITGLGWVTPLGHDVESVWRRLLAGESGVAPTTLFDASSFPTTFGAEVKGYDLAVDVADPCPHRRAGRSTQFAVGACAQAWRLAGLPFPDGTAASPSYGTHLDLDRVGLYLAGGEGSLDFDAFTGACLAAWDSTAGAVDTVAWATAALTRMDAIRELEQEPNLALTHLARLTGARGPALNSLTACAASAQAIGEAAHVIRRGDADVMIAGGTHSMIHPFGVAGFNRLTTLSTRNDSPTEASRPFDADRGGFVLGEGAGIVILESREHAEARGARVLAEVAGYGSTADAYRITDQDPTGAGMVGAMRAALHDAGVTPVDVDYVNAHGTGTRENDGNETAAIKAVFGDHARRVPVSSIKSMFGHFITAAGAVELIACVLAIRDGVVPPTINLRTPDPHCDLDYVPNVARRVPVDVALSLNLGFGGQNDALVVRRPRWAGDPARD